MCISFILYFTAFKISLTIDEKHKRTKMTSLELFSENTLRDKCVNTNVTLSVRIHVLNIYKLYNCTDLLLINNALI